MRIFKYIHPIGVSVFALLLFCILSIPGYARIDPESVVGIWLLNESDDNIARDASENGHDGEIKGDPEWEEGVFGDCLKFDGSGDFVDCGNAETLNLGAFGVAFWASFPATQGWNHMVSKGSHVTSGDPGSVNWGVMMRSGEARFLFEVFQDTTWAGISSPAVSPDEWQHLVANYDGDKMEFFLNGASLGSSTGNTVELDASRSFRIGGIATAGVTPGNFFSGSIDEVALFNEALPLEDIQELMNLGIEEALKLTPVEAKGKLATTWGCIRSLSIQ
jgi:hypothetical protein